MYTYEVIIEGDMGSANEDSQHDNGDEFNPSNNSFDKFKIYSINTIEYQYSKLLYQQQGFLYTERKENTTLYLYLHNFMLKTLKNHVTCLHNV